MGISSKHSVIATLYLALSASALPYPLSYSVVNVDGGSQGANTSPATVYQTVTASAEAEETTTIIETPTITAIVTDYTTSWSHAEATETALIPVVSLPQISPNGYGHPTPHLPTPVPSPPSTIEETTVTVVSTVTPTPTTTTSYYDDGMWHTTYAIKEVSSPPYIPAVSYSAVPTGSGYSYSAGGWNSTKFR